MWPNPGAPDCLEALCAPPPECSTQNFARCSTRSALDAPVVRSTASINAYYVRNKAAFGFQRVTIADADGRRGRARVVSCALSDSGQLDARLKRRAVDSTPLGRPASETGLSDAIGVFTDDTAVRSCNIWI